VQEAKGRYTVSKGKDGVRRFIYIPRLIALDSRFPIQPPNRNADVWIRIEGDSLRITPIRREGE